MSAWQSILVQYLVLKCMYGYGTLPHTYVILYKVLRIAVLADKVTVSSWLDWITVMAMAMGRWHTGLVNLPVPRSETGHIAEVEVHKLPAQSPQLPY